MAIICFVIDTRRLAAFVRMHWMTQAMDQTYVDTDASHQPGWLEQMQYAAWLVLWKVIMAALTQTSVMVSSTAGKHRCTNTYFYL